MNFNLTLQKLQKYSGVVAYVILDDSVIQWVGVAGGKCGLATDWQSFTLSLRLYNCYKVAVLRRQCCLLKP